MNGYNDEGLLQYHDPVGWRFYRYGEDADGEPLFSFWMNISIDTGVCVYERNAGEGKWLGTSHEPDEYEGEPPSSELKACICDAIGDGIGVEAEAVEALPDHEEYFFRIVHGTLEEKKRLPPGVMRFIEECVGNGVHIR